jgi:hypothetical protein
MCACGMVRVQLVELAPNPTFLVFGFTARHVSEKLLTSQRLSPQFQVWVIVTGPNLSVLFPALLYGENQITVGRSDLAPVAQ